MSNRAHLVPEVRTDRNGVPVRRWVRVEAAAPAGAIPSPASPAPSQSEDLFAVVEARLAADGMPNSWDGRRGWQLGQEERFHWNLSRFAPETIETISEMLDRETNEAAAYGIVATVMGNMFDRGGHETRVRAYAMFAAPLDDEDPNFGLMEAVIRGLGHYAPDVLPEMADYTQGDERTRAACSALVLVAARLYDAREPSAFQLVSMVDDPSRDDGLSWGEDEDGEDWQSTTPVVGNRELAAFIAAHPESAQRIADTIESEGFESVATLRERLHSDGATALARGAL